jgi:hypothetical protein
MKLFLLVDRKTDEIRGTSPMGYGPDALIPEGCEVLEVDDVDDGQPGVKLDRKNMRLVVDQDARDAIKIASTEDKLVGLYVTQAGLAAAEAAGLDTKGQRDRVDELIDSLHDTLAELRGETP